MDVKSKTDINKTNQTELRDYANRLTVAYSNLQTEHQTLKDEHKETLNRLKSVEATLTEALRSISALTMRTIALEKHLNEQNQYAQPPN